MNSYCFVIPVYNHAQGITNTITKLKVYQLPCVVVDDGSDAACAAAIDTLATLADVEVVRHPVNRGKGGAVKSGLKRAQELGYSHAIQLDADEQHDLANLGEMRAQAEADPEAMIIGQPIYDETVPRGRYYGRYATHVWVWINTLSRAIPDAMCGFRIYPLKAAVALIDNTHVGERMDFDVEILVKLSWSGIRFVPVPVKVHYDPEIPSHFHYLKDNLLIAAMHTRLFFGMLLRSPRLIAAKFSSGS